MTNQDSRISILLPTRGRPDTLVKSVLGLVESAEKPGLLEIMFGVDSDDPDTLDAIKNRIAPRLIELGIEARAIQFETLGYGKLHEYVNTLANSSTGDWLFFWNDDALMETEGWDEEIRQHDGEFRLLAPTDNHDGHPYAIFPIVPRDWLVLLGHLSQNAQNDAWLSQIAYMLDIFQRLDFRVTHDRADITGNNNDATFQARVYKEGNPEDPEDFHHTSMKQARLATAAKIAWFLDRTGRDTSWWQAVIAGKQNPFEKMVAAPGVKGAGQQPAIQPGNETITL
jgi:hypothetical protein